jgi:diguanylate cyclase (GGDEF)-like protein
MCPPCLTLLAPAAARLIRAALGWLVVPLGLLLGAWGAQAQTPPPLPVVVLSEMSSTVALAGQSQFLIDSSGRLGMDELEARQAVLPFAVYPAGHKLVLAEGAALWVRFTLRQSDQDNVWQLLVNQPGVDDVSLYYRGSNSTWVLQRSGDRLPQSMWPQHGRQPVLALSPQTGREVAYFLRVQHARVPFSGGLFLKTQTAMAEREQGTLFVLGAYFGLATLAVFVALANALVHRDHGFGTAAIYMTTMALGQAGSTGVGGMLFWPELPALNYPMAFFMPMVAGASGVWFVRTIATPRQYSTLLDRLAVGVILALLAVAALDVFVPSGIGFDLSMNLVTLSMVLVLLLLLLAMGRGDRHSRWIAAGFALIVLGGAFPVARNFGLMPSGFLSEYGLILGSALQMPLLFHGLNSRLHEQTESRARARALAVTDPLTGLGSERKLLMQLQAALDRARPGRPLALMLVELANHASLAREHGREGADRALVLTAARLRNVVRDIDTVARVGNQHFALLLESPCTQDEANAMATQIVAMGLRHSTALPEDATLRLHVVLGMLPLPDLDARGTLEYLQQELGLITPESRKTIRTLSGPLRASS